MNCMISQPMGGLSEAEIRVVQNKARNYLLSLGYKIPDTYFEDEEPSGVKVSGLYWLGRSIVAMSECDAVYFCKGWEKARGCQIEHDAAKTYGIKCIYE